LSRSLTIISVSLIIFSPHRGSSAEDLFLTEKKPLYGVRFFFVDSHHLEVLYRAGMYLIIHVEKEPEYFIITIMGIAVVT